MGQLTCDILSGYVRQPNDQSLSRHISVDHLPPLHKRKLQLIGMCLPEENLVSHQFLAFKILFTEVGASRTKLYYHIEKLLHTSSSNFPLT